MRDSLAMTKVFANVPDLKHKGAVAVFKFQWKIDEKIVIPANAGISYAG
jgi:hypothetical protein